MDITLIYITTKDTEEARRIGRTLVEERLVACVNIVDNVNSLYWWEEKIVDDREAIVIAKTKGTLVPAVIERVKSLHGYSCPCVVALPIVDGNKDFLSWVCNETVTSSDSRPNFG
jgi:periplasmic divalent cation tolerance protein